MAKKYSPKDLIYDVAYVAVLLGAVLFVIGSFPEFFGKVLQIFKLWNGFSKYYSAEPSNKSICRDILFFMPSNYFYSGPNASKNG